MTWSEPASWSYDTATNGKGLFAYDYLQELTRAWTRRRRGIAQLL